jgi:hypothetical protein
MQRPVPNKRVPHLCIWLSSLRPELSTDRTEQRSTTISFSGASFLLDVHTLQSSSTDSPASFPSTYRVVASGCSSTRILNIVSYLGSGKCMGRAIPSVIKINELDLVRERVLTIGRQIAAIWAAAVSNSRGTGERGSDAQPVDAELFHLSLQGGPLQTEPCRSAVRTTENAVCFAQDLENVFAFGVFQG